jgi:hypothetical protein
MSAYNTVISTQVCGSCGNEINLVVQFKYGDVWQYQYHIGDILNWGGNDAGRKDAARVVVDGVAERCPICNFEGADYEVWIENNRIISVHPASGEYDFVNCQETYIILE